VTAQQYYQYDPEAPREANRPNNAAPPPPANLTPHEKVVRERLVKFYAQHNPAVIARVDKVMARYRGREAELWRDLHEKYIADDLGTWAPFFLLLTRVY
jgi:hypothetical protein